MFVASGVEVRVAEPRPAPTSMDTTTGNGTITREAEEALRDQASVRVALGEHQLAQLAAGRFLALGVGWNATHLCVYADRGESEIGACSAEAHALTPRAQPGYFSLFGSAEPDAPDELASTPPDVDTVLLFSRTLSRSERSRGWFDRRNDADLLISVTFDEGGDADHHCPCGALQPADSDLRLANIDCDVAVCREAAPLPSLSVDATPIAVVGATQRLAGDDAARNAAGCSARVQHVVCGQRAAARAVARLRGDRHRRVAHAVDVRRPNACRHAALRASCRCFFCTLQHSGVARRCGDIQRRRPPRQRAVCGVQRQLAAWPVHLPQRRRGAVVRVGERRVVPLCLCWCRKTAHRLDRPLRLLHSKLHHVRRFVA